MSTAKATEQQEQILQTICGQGMLPLFFHPDVEVSTGVLRALYAAGVRSIEYTNRGEAALDNFAALRKVCDEELPGMWLGVGTIKNGKQASAFIDAGADYLISPGLVKAAAKVARKHDRLYIPGCMTPTEIIRAEAMGAGLVKIFPGNVLGPGFIAAIRDVFPSLKFIVTGGVEPEEENLRRWFSSGVSAVGMGSKLISKEILQAKDYTQLTAVTTAALSQVQSIRQ